MFSKVKKVVLFLALFLMVGAGVSTSSLANSVQGNETTSQGSVVQSSSREYVTEYRNFYKTSYVAPPSSVYVSRTINGFLYGGYIDRFQYVDAGDYWLTTYKGYLIAI